jgi:regulator of replication initiation timing
MKDSLLIMEKEKKEIEQTNEEYEDKLAMLSQEIERLRGIIDPMRRENESLRMANKDLHEKIKRS